MSPTREVKTVARHGPGRKYTDEEKAAALAALAGNGGNVERTAAQLGMPEATLRHWQKSGLAPSVAILCDQKKAALADIIEDTARKILGDLPGKIGAADLKESAIALAVLIDKMQLLRSKPTQIVNMHGTVTGKVDRFAAALAELDGEEEDGTVQPGVGGEEAQDGQE